MAKMNSELKELKDRISILQDAPKEWERGNGNKYIRELLQREVLKALKRFYELHTHHKGKKMQPSGNFSQKTETNKAS